MLVQIQPAYKCKNKNKKTQNPTLNNSDPSNTIFFQKPSHTCNLAIAIMYIQIYT